MTGDNSTPSGTLQERLAECGLLPGDKTWPDDILSVFPGFLDEWAVKIVQDTSDDIVVYESAITQIRRLFPGMTERDRKYLRVGIVVHHVWLYAYLAGRANKTTHGRLPEADAALLDYLEYKTTVLNTLLNEMEDDVDMSSFEGFL